MNIETTSTRVPTTMTSATFSDSDALKRELVDLLNKHSRENFSNTPDFILADVMLDALEAFERASENRESWYGKHMSILDAGQTPNA